MITALAIFILSFISVGWSTWINSTQAWLITLSFVPFVIGQIIPSTLLYPICLNYIPDAKGKISAILQGGRLIICALSLQLAGHFYQHSFQNIGIILDSFILMVVITLFWVIVCWESYRVNRSTEKEK